MTKVDVFKERTDSEKTKNAEINQLGMNESGQLSLSWEFVRLPSRPMVRVDIPAHGLARDALEDFIRQTLEGLDPESVVKLHMKGRVREEALSVLRAESLRALSPSQMNISLSFHDRMSSHLNRPLREK